MDRESFSKLLQVLAALSDKTDMLISMSLYDDGSGEIVDKSTGDTLFEWLDYDSFISEYNDYMNDVSDSDQDSEPVDLDDNLDWLENEDEDEDIVRDEDEPYEFEDEDNDE